MVGSRSPFQCREHYDLKYNHPDKYTNWSMEDDIKLLDLYDQYKCKLETKIGNSLLTLIFVFSLKHDGVKYQKNFRLKMITLVCVDLEN